MEHDEDKRTRRLLRFAFGLAAIASAGGALAQVTPVEPFGGRPFGSDPAAPVPQQRGAAQQQPPTVVQPGTAPVLVQPGGAPVVVQPQVQPQQAVQAPAPQPAPAPPPPVQAQPQTQQQNMAGPSGRPSSSVNAQQGNGTTTSARQERQQDGDMAVPPIVNPPAAAAAPAPVTPPFGANRAPGTGTAGAAAASPAQQAVRGLPADAPKLVISGSVYSPDSARRMLIVNGQVYREGADLGSGVVLQEVRPDSAVLGFKGGRYNVYF